MIARLLQIAALAAALVATPALAKSHKHGRKHAAHKHARAAAKATRVKHTELAKADPAPAPAPEAAPERARTDESSDAAPSGGRRVVTHSIYNASSDKAD